MWCTLREGQIKFTLQVVVHFKFILTYHVYPFCNKCVWDLMCFLDEMNTYSNLDNNLPQTIKPDTFCIVFVNLQSFSPAAPARYMIITQFGWLNIGEACAYACARALVCESNRSFFFFFFLVQEEECWNRNERCGRMGHKVISWIWLTRGPF